MFLILSSFLVDFGNYNWVHLYILQILTSIYNFQAFGHIICTTSIVVSCHHIFFHYQNSNTPVGVMYTWSWVLIPGGDNASLLPQPPNLQEEPMSPYLYVYINFELHEYVNVDVNHLYF